MQISADKAIDFFNHYFQSNHQYQNSFDDIQNISEIGMPVSWGLDFKSHKSPSINHPKSIKEYGFIKKYDIVCASFSYVSALRPDQLQTNQVLAAINCIYDNYINFVKMGLWKAYQPQSHLQQFLLLLLNDVFGKPELRYKKRYAYIDRFVLSFFYTLNILKTCNKYIKVFCNFLSGVSSFVQLFLYLCFKNAAVYQNGDQTIGSNIMKKIIKVFQADDQSHHNISITLSKQSVDLQQGKRVNIDSIFVEPITGNLSVPKFKLYKIMKICRILDLNDEQDGIQWGEFLGKYFEMVEQNQITFKHIVCAAVAKSTFELSTKLLTQQNQQIQQQFRQEAFGYVFQILQIILSERQPEIEDQLTGKNVQSLRRHYQYMKALNEQNVTVLNKFTKKILKNNYILELYKKYV